MTETINLALGLGFLLGLKHATEADHIVAVSTIVSEQRSVWRSALVGALWGLGHTLSLLIAGLVVILFRVAIPERAATYLEFAVALMIILLGSHVLYRVLRDNRRVHVHAHEHDGYAHTHLHFHDERSAHDPREAQHHARHAHIIGNLGWKPLLVGMMHGLAGSAALTLLVLTEVMRGGSSALGLAYLLIFGIGSIGGMLLMSALISLPFVFTAERFARINTPIRLLAGLGSVVFGFYYAWEVWVG
ncbi:MAG: urease accessory protein UreH [Pyrinomonas sp.]|uniref:HoxN/HupN/NixA family nickel/cobalt transporter n=1 Tax=Pyrinomonas sp. TaxID=2080306 RepID=UPI00331AC0B2